MRFGRKRGKRPAEREPALAEGLQALPERHAELVAELAELRQAVVDIGSTRRKREDQLASLAEQGHEPTAQREELHRQALSEEARLIDRERKARQRLDEFTVQMRTIEDHAKQLRNLTQAD